MALTLAQINEVALRLCFLPWFKDEMKYYGIPLPEDWNPTDDELNRLVDKVCEAFSEEHGET